MHPSAHNTRGTISLVALCFVTVLGIVLGSYLAVCSRAMNLSNRSFQANLSQQLAEMGLEEGLRAFNNTNLSGTDTTAALADWTTNGTTANWTLDTTNKRASCAISFPAGKFGQGVTATVKVRVDNYDSSVLPSAWSSSTNYLVGNVVSYTDGNWYRCIASNQNKAPSTTASNSTYWIQENNLISSSMTWVNGITHYQGNMVNRNGYWFRYTSASSSATAPPTTAVNNPVWTYVPFFSADADLHYVDESILNYYNIWYRYYNTIPWESNPTLTWRWRASNSYNVGDVISINNVWYRCKAAHTSGSSFSTTNWDTASTLAASAAAAWNWSSTNTYNLNDVVYRSGVWYTSTSPANLNNSPSSTSSNWSTSPILPVDWDPDRQYSQYDTVRYRGVWYLSLTSTSNINQVPSVTGSSYWIGADTTTSSYIWNSTTSYSSGAYRCYSGVWYKATAANTNKSPNDTSSWTPSWSNSSGQTSGAPVIYAESTITIAGYPPSKTQLRAVIAPAPLFPNAVGSRVTTTLDVSTTGTVDSYNSTTDPSAAAPDYTAVVAGLSTSSGVVSSGSATINGYVAAPTSSSSPTTPFFTYSTTAVVKGTSVVPSPKVDATRVSRSPYVPQFAIHSVTGGSALSTGTTIGTAGATTPTVYYYAGDLDLDGSSTSLTIVGPVILNIQGHLRIRNSAKLTIAETGSAEIHVSGYFRIYATGILDNQTNVPKNCVVLCTATTGTFYYRAPSPAVFCGVIYIPGEDLAVDGTNSIIFGAISARNVTVSNALTFHYDTSLRYAAIPGVDQPYAITQWRELPLTEQATMP